MAESQHSSHARPRADKSICPPQIIRSVRIARPGSPLGKTALSNMPGIARESAASSDDEADAQLSSLAARLAVKSRPGGVRKIWYGDDSNFSGGLCGQPSLMPASMHRHWTGRYSRGSCSSGGIGGIALSDSTRPLLSGSNSRIQLDVNNSSQGIDMLNMPSTAEATARQKSWMQIYFRYRLKWHEAKPHLEKLTKEEAYQPENLNLWTRYVKITLQRRVPFLNAVRVFRNRVKCPDVQIRYTLNSFYRKGSENERLKNAGPLHPVPLPVSRCPDDIPEFRKMTVAVINVFVTTDDTFFDQFWSECSGAH